MSSDALTGASATMSPFASLKRGSIAWVAGANVVIAAINMADRAKRIYFSKDNQSIHYCQFCMTD